MILILLPYRTVQILLVLDKITLIKLMIKKYKVVIEKIELITIHLQILLS